MDDGPELTIGSRVETTHRRLMATFWVAAVASLVLPRIPYGRTLLYPFALLGTWAHEMGHGLVGIVVGGSFERLEVYRNLGGVASIGDVGSIARVLVSAGGLLGPAVFGALVIVYGAKVATARWVLAVLGVVVLLSVLLVVRNLFGMVAFGLIGASLAVLGFKGPELIRLGVAQLIGIQFCLASWGTLDYLFTKNFVRDGVTVDSDTQNIAEVLVLPYWFWGGLISVLSAAILFVAFYRAWVLPFRASTAVNSAGV